MADDSDCDGAYLTAFNASQALGSRSELAYAFARRIAQQHGLSMSRQRGLKSLAYSLERNRDLLSRIG